MEEHCFSGQTTHDWLEPLQTQRVDSPEGRYYVTPEGLHYPSVTSVLGKDKEHFITEWRNAVGEVEANRVSERASTRGTTLHNHAEMYLRNQQVTIPKVRFLDVSLMRGLVPYLNRISNVRILEGQLYSHTFKLAGTVDCVGDFDSVKSTIDFKSSTKIKERYEIDDYFMQVAIYSYMLTERYGLNYNQLVVLIAQEFGAAQVFIDDRRNWRARVQQLINN